MDISQGFLESLDAKEQRSLYWPERLVIDFNKASGIVVNKMDLFISSVKVSDNFFKNLSTSTSTVTNLVKY